MGFPPVPRQYVKVFLESLEELPQFLDGIRELFFKEWQGLYGIMPLGNSQDDPRLNRMMVPGFTGGATEYSPFCHYVRTELGKENLCRRCDARVVERVARNGEPSHYWCDWGLIDIAVPINLHGFCVGILFCGQKRLEGEADIKGLETMKKFAREQGLQDRLPELLEKRAAAPSVSQTQIQNVKGILWATSRYISQILYIRLNLNIINVREENRRRIFGLMSKTSSLAEQSNIFRFWNDMKGVLKELTSLFDCRGITVCHTEGDTTNLACSYGLSLGQARLEALSEDELITKDLEPSDGPRHVPVRFHFEVPDCKVCEAVLNAHRQVDMILFDKSSKFGGGQVIHVLVFLESSLPAKHLVTFQQKEIILDEFVRVTKNVFWLLQETENLKNATKNYAEFVKDVVHQINQPLHSVVGYCDNLMSPAQPQEKKERLPRKIREAARHCSIMMRNIDWANQEKPVLTPQTLQRDHYLLADMLVDFAINVQGFAEDRNIRVHVDRHPCEAIGVVYVDKSALEIPVTNVLYNAIKYSFAGTTTTVSASHEKRSSSLVITVRNIGISVPEGMSEEIFDRRFRAPEAKRYSYSGLGIGLWVTREVLKVMEGTVYVVKSDPMPGPKIEGRQSYESVFALTLPETVIER